MVYLKLYVNVMNYINVYLLNFFIMYVVLNCLYGVLLIFFMIKSLLLVYLKKIYVFNLLNVNIIKELCNLERILFKVLEFVLRNDLNV